MSAGKYRTIVADPPWEYESWPGVMGPKSRWKPDGPRDNRRKKIGYETMSVDGIRSLPVHEWADPIGCHIYLWTTNRYLRESFAVLDAWGVRFGQVLVWAKTPMGLGPGGAFAQSTEYVLHGRRGSLRHLRRVDSTWFNWPRMDRQHSRKPEAFMDMVEQVSPGPYLELFARRQRLGWDTWGNEALEHVSLGNDAADPDQEAA